MTTGIVFDIKRFSIHDGPGIRTTVFLKGCPLSCWWCHNPEGQAGHQELVLRPERCIGCGACVDACERGGVVRQGNAIVTQRERCRICGRCVETCYAGARELVGRVVTVEKVIGELERDSPFYDQSGGGVTFSGGEPLAQPDFLEDVLRAAKHRGFHTTLDTCGFSAWETMDRVRKMVDLFLYDLKLMEDAEHRRVTGVSNAPILRNLERLSQLGHRIVLRVPVIPGINDDEENVRQIGALAADLPSLEYVDLLGYHRVGRDKHKRLGKACPLPEVVPPSEAKMAVIRDALSRGAGSA